MLCRRALALALCLGAIRCRRVEVLDPGLLGERFFFASGSEPGAPTTLSPIYRAGEAQALLELPNGSRTWAVGLQSKALRELEPRLAEEPWALEVGLTPPPETARLVAHDEGVVAELHLPETAPVLAADDGRVASEAERDALLGALTLSLPLELEPCRTEPLPVLRPYGARADLLEDSAWQHRWLQLQPVEQGVLALGATAIYLVHPGESFDGYDDRARDQRAPGRTVALFGIDRNAQLARFALGAENGGERPLVAVGVTAVGDQEVGAAWRFVLSPAGLRYAGTATRTDSGRLNDVSFDGEGTLLMVGESDTLLIQRPQGPLLRKPAPGLAPQSFRRVLAGAPAVPRHLLVTGGGRFYFGDAVSAQWSDPQRVLMGLEDVLDAAAAQQELWASGNGLARFADGRWIEVLPSYTPGLAACGELAPGGHLALGSERVDLDVGQGFVYVSARDCDRLLRVRASDGCGSALSPWTEVQASSAAAAPPYALRADQGRLYVGGAHGLLLAGEL